MLHHADTIAKRNIIIVKNFPQTAALFLLTAAAVVLQCGFPAGERILFVSERDGEPEIYAADRDGSAVVRLTDNSVEDAQPAGAPDGKRFLYLSRRGEGETLEIMVGFYDTSETHVQLTSDYYNEMHASWSPDGSHICFSRDVNGSVDIWVMDDLGETQIPITSNPGSDRQPEWSPKSGWIAFVSQSALDEKSIPQIYLIKSDGTNIQQLTFSDAPKSDPAWMPDGSAVYFMEYDSGTDEPYRLRAVNPETAAETAVISFTEPITHPCPSADNNTLVYTISGKGARAEIYLYDLLAGREIRLTNNVFRDFDPRWIW